MQRLENLKSHILDLAFDGKDAYAIQQELERRDLSDVEAKHIYKYIDEFVAAYEHAVQARQKVLMQLGGWILVSLGGAVIVNTSIAADPLFRGVGMVMLFSGVWMAWRHFRVWRAPLRPNLTKDMKFKSQVVRRFYKAK